ncbi:MAG TPA: hypothetical protein VK210_17265 [Terriglobia bacterium]|nr:hypothetical protein [Terriglobia bacterium]
MKSTISAIVLACFLIPPSLFARCPISANSTLVVNASVGNLIIDSSGTDSVDWDVSNKQIAVQEICLKDEVSLIGTASNGTIKPIPDWHIKVPRNVNLDLVTKAGSITIGQLDSKINVRTGGGDVVVGNIAGETSILTQAGNIQAGDIGSNADLNIDSSGNLVLGNVKGDVSVSTRAGDITIASARRIVNAFTGGGTMLIHKVIGSFTGHNDAGSIRIESAGSWVDASTGSGSIFLKMVPEKQTGDLHVNLQAGSGDITLFLPNGMKADIQATGLQSQMKSDFPLIPQVARGFSGLAPTTAGRPGPNISSSFTTTQTGQRNGGGNPVKLHTSLGKIEIKLFN